MLGSESRESSRRVLPAARRGRGCCAQVQPLGGQRPATLTPLTDTCSGGHNQAHGAQNLAAGKHIAVKRTLVFPMDTQTDNPFGALEVTWPLPGCSGGPRWGPTRPWCRTAKRSAFCLAVETHRLPAWRLPLGVAVLSEPSKRQRTLHVGRAKSPFGFSHQVALVALGCL